MFKSLLPYLMALLSQPALADAGIALGINLTNDFAVGITLKVLSSDKVNKFVVAAGTSFYPFSENKTGVDLGFGATSGLNTYFLYGVDIYQEDSYMSMGFFYSDSQRE